MTGRPLQIEYLRAMGIEVWLQRGNETPATAGAEEPIVEGEPAEPQTAGSRAFVVGPGEARLLFLCESPGESGLPIAADIARALGEAPAWGWPAAAGDSAAAPLEAVIRERLFTGVLVFGQLAGPGEDRPVSGSARIVRAPSLGTLAGSPEARRKLWSVLRETGWCADRRRPS